MSPFSTMKTGHVAPEDLKLCSWSGAVEYPYRFIGKANKQRVVDAFFANGKVFQRKWDFFYLYPQQHSPKFILLVPAIQFADFLTQINQELHTKLTIPSGETAMAFNMTFPNDGNPRPRYVAESNDKAMADQIKTAIPPSNYKPDEGDYATPSPDDLSLEAFRHKIGILRTLEKQKKTDAKAKRQRQKTEKHQAWMDSVKRVQRFLGLREVGHGHQQVDQVNVNVPAPFAMESDLLFVCVDVEAYEKDHSKVTEIGVSTLDTRDLVGVAPGENGQDWFELIRPRHFRIKEHSTLRNGDFVHGCPDRFMFGKSEWIGLHDCPKMIASCFEAPFSFIGPLQETVEGNEAMHKRRVVFVGHDAPADIRYLQTIGYDVLKLPLFGLVDTADMYRALYCEVNTKGLGFVCADLGIAGWNLHNAGNDAYYTMNLMIAIAIAALKRNHTLDRAEGEKRVAEAVENARVEAEEALRSWKDAGGDGGYTAMPPIDIPASTTGVPPNSGALRRKIAGFAATGDSKLVSNAEPDVLQEIAARATKSIDSVLISALAGQAAKDKSLARLMQFVADGSHSDDQLNTFTRKLEKIKGGIAAREGVGQEEFSHLSL